MRLVRYKIGKNEPTWGWALEDRVGAVEGDIFGEFRRLEANISLADVQLLAPVLPGKIIEVGRNFINPESTSADSIPEIPNISLKPPSAVIGQKGIIHLPPQSQRVEHEVELAVVMGKQGRWIEPDQVNQYILGYTVGNDVTARDLQLKDTHKARSKSFDTFCPLGPWIETEFEPTDVLLTCRVNGTLRQMASTREMVFSVAKLIAFISSIMTLLPGDIILCGTPGGSDALLVGDVVECSIEGIGVLENSVQ